MRHVLPCVLVLALCGCTVAAGPYSGGCTPTGSTRSFSLGDFIVSPTPKAFCEGTTIVCPDGWQVCNGGGDGLASPMAAEPMVLMPAATLERVAGARRTGVVTSEASTVDGDEYPRVISRTVTRYEEGPDGETVVTETTDEAVAPAEAAARRCP